MFQIIVRSYIACCAGIEYINAELQFYVDLFSILFKKTFSL